MTDTGRPRPVEPAGGRLHLIRARALSHDTAQTPGMSRAAAVSGAVVGARGIFMGETRMGPGVASGPHHHGESETAIYVVAGDPIFVFKEGNDEVRLRTAPGDYVYVPPFVPHIESNAHSDHEAVVVVARTTQEAVVVNLDHL